MEPYYGRLVGSGSVWRNTDPDPGHVNVQNKAMAKEVCVNKLVFVDIFHQVLKPFLKNILLHNFFFISKQSTADKKINQL